MVQITEIEILNGAAIDTDCIFNNMVRSYSFYSWFYTVINQKINHFKSTLDK